MELLRRPFMMVAIVAIATLSACGNGAGGNTLGEVRPADTSAEEDTIWDAFGPDNADQTVRVNKYIWAASQEVLDFLPIQTVDPFSGVISTGYGTPPGGGRSYRATIFVRDAALDARSLNVALQSNGGRAVPESTARAVEDAILTRARQLRIEDKKI
ncbi:MULTISPECIES: DUF3576 domain-containing protein [unclassified Shimia]|uniref:DUF3576 domain-containing protein n=1 Tax=unclassified Shimia TaxID=2630038 RepID=UPI001ADC4B75|nr:MULTISPECIES: DUF3576 domain-containing protein [unclassified Shimia]MBO9472861.1 DUF3576 domain-containing protein [Shimia sp. R10_1]MDA5556556.1 DUF3576 domain-containing protein [Shimia sp. MMG029]